jgi:4-aminobutyrate aminotransferase
MLVLGKGLGGGIFPLAALLTKAKFDVMQKQALGHYTHEKNPVACAAGLATIESLEQDALLDNARIVGNYALQRLQAMMEKYPIIGDVRGLGLLLGVELVKDRKSKDRAFYEAEQVMYRALELGLSFKLTMGNILTLTPALTITREEMKNALDILDECIKTTC